MFQKNQAVEAYFDDGWYHGIVHKINEDGTYVVHFDDGDVADDIRPDEIRSPQNHNDKNSNMFEEDDGDDDPFGDEPKQSAGLQRASNSPIHHQLQQQQHQQQQHHSHNFLSPDIILPKVEEFLLPKVKRRSDEEAIADQLLPTSRLDGLLLELAIGEHIRMCQYLYRDNEDECNVASEIRELSNDGPVRISSKQLTDSLIEGRSRVVALCRLCYGDQSIEYLRAIVDLASVYAMQGLWEQVSHHMTIASQKLITVTQSFQLSLLRTKSHDAALYTKTLFAVLRTHAIKHRGYITASFLTEVYNEIYSVAHSAMASKTSQIKQEEYYNELLSAESQQSQPIPTQTPTQNQTPTQPVELTDPLDLLSDDILSTNPQHDHLDHTKKTVATAICQEIEDFLTQFLGPKGNWNQSLSQFSPPTWGQVVVFLTTQSNVVKKWMELIEKMILPQNKTLLRMVFQLADKTSSNTSHPQELTHLLQHYPSVTKILSGTSILINLKNIPLEVPLLLDGQTGEVLNYMTPELQCILGSTHTSTTPPTQQVKYELPICWIEFLSMVLFEWNTEGCLDSIEYLRIHILNLMSLCSVYSNQLPLAEENMKNALGRIELLGLEMESIAIDVYNGISQLMIVKHKQWHSEKKERCFKNAIKWLQTKEGKHILLNEIKNIRIHYLEHKKIQLSSTTIEEMATKVILKSHSKQLMETEIDPTTQSLEAAYRYMIRTFEILEKLHGDHITVASASLAIASVQNIIGAYDESKEWLVRSIRIMEKLKPLPLRAIAFTQTQLSLILMKLKHTKSAEKVLSVAVDYYTNHVMKKLNRQSRLLYTTLPSSGFSGSGIGGGVGVGGGGAAAAGGGAAGGGAAGGTNNPMKGFLSMGPFGINSNVLQDIEVTLDLLKRLMILNGENGASWQAAEYAENMADLSEAAYGWDSQETAELRKQAGERQCRVKDWGRACGNFKKSLDAHQILFGEKDKRSLSIKKQLQMAEKKRDEEMIPSEMEGVGEEEMDSIPRGDEKE